RIGDGNTPKANPQQHYVVSGMLSSINLSPHALAHNADELTRLMGRDVYDLMITDPHVSSSVKLMIQTALADGIQARPTFRSKDPKFKRAQQISDFCARQLTRIQQPFVTILETILTEAFTHGNKVAELTWEIPRFGPDRAKLVLKSINPIQRRRVTFVVDTFMNLVGILGFRVGMGMYPVFGNGFVDKQQLLPKEKFFIATFEPHNNDPRGRSQIRSAFNPWNVKNSIWPECLRFAQFAAVPGLILVAAQDALDVELRNQNGDIVYAADGITPIVQTPEQQLASAGMQMANSRVLAVPHGTDAKFLESKHDGQVFTSLMNLVSEQIAKAIMFVTLANREGRSQARAASQTHLSIWELAIWWLKITIGMMIQQAIFRPAVAYNFGDAVAEEFLPQCSLGDKPIPNFNEIAQGVAQLVGQGAVDEAQLPELDAKMGLEPRDLTDRKPASITIQETTTQNQNPAETPSPQKSPNSDEGEIAA